MSGQCYNGDGTGHDDQPRTTLRDVLARSSSPKPGPSFDPDNAKYWRHLFDCCHDGCGLDERATYTPVEHLGGGRFGFECQRGHRWTCWFNVELAERDRFADCPCRDCRQEYGARHALYGKPPFFHEFLDIDDLPAGDEPQWLWCLAIAAYELRRARAARDHRPTASGAHCPAH